MENSAHTAIAMMMQAIPAFVAEWTGIPLDYVFEPWQHVMQWSFPVHLPTQGELDEMYMQGVITDSQWECWTRAQGNMPKSHRMARDTKAQRTAIPECIDLFMRKGFTENELWEELRIRGVKDKTEMYRWLALKRQVPTFADIITMMVKGATDPENIERDNLMEGFGDAYSPQLRQWAEQNGMTDDVARAYWAAHWQEVSPTQVYQFLHRLRPGRVPKALEFDMARAYKTVKEADYPPGLVPHLLAVSYLPINRTDLIAMIKAGTIDRKSVSSVSRTLGTVSK